MTAGIEVYSELGYKVADSNDPSLVYYGKSTVVTGNYNVLGSGFSGSLNIGAVAVPAMPGKILTFYKTNGEPFVEQGGVIFTPSAGVVIECFHYGAAVQGGLNYGLEVFDPNGMLTFSTASPYLKVVGVFVDTVPASVPSSMPTATWLQYSLGTSFAEPSGKKYAYQFSNAHYYYQIVRPLGRPSASYNYCRVASINSAGTYYTRYVPKLYWTHGDQNTRLREVPNKEAPMRMLVIDVTGL